MEKAIVWIVCMLLVAVCIPPCGARAAENTLQENARTAMQDLYRRYWTEEDGGHIINTHAGKPVDGPSVMIWERGMMIMAMESYYAMTGDADTLDKMRREWDYIQRIFDWEHLTSRCGKSPNTAADDAGWDVMVYMAFYRALGDEFALKCTGELLKNAFIHFGAPDEMMTEGMWYCDNRQYGGDQWKSVYCAAFVLVGLDYLEAAGPDEKLETQIMNLYHWMEANLRRDRVITWENCYKGGKAYTSTCTDCLYWCDFNEDRATRSENFAPDGVASPDAIRDNRSVTALFGNMAMAAVNMTLYQKTGNEAYRQKALATAQGVAEKYNNGGAYINDRDHQTNGAYCYYYVTRVLTDPDAAQARALHLSTADSIMANARNDKGLYSVIWRAPKNKLLQIYETNLMRNANTAHIVVSAGLLDSLLEQ